MLLVATNSSGQRRTIGTLDCNADKFGLFINLLNIVDKERGGGIGKGFLKYAIDIIKKEGKYSRIYLESNPQNGDMPAKVLDDFYKKIGFVPSTTKFANNKKPFFVMDLKKE